MFFWAEDIKKNGFSVVEMALAVVIGSILMTTAAMMLYQIQTSMSRGEQDLTLLSNMRHARMMIQSEARKAKDVNIVSGTEINMYYLDAATRTIKLSGTDLTMDDWSTGVNPDYLLSTDIKNINIIYHDTTTQSSIKVYLELEKIVTHHTDGIHAVVESSDTFVTKLRNKKTY
ncbi:MAG: prepilin-type N-terminal cleavage/methylation domain-containing protein [Elusimicrobiota bacterium]